MSGQAAGFVVCVVLGVVAGVETFRGWWDRRRDAAEAERVFHRDGR